MLKIPINAFRNYTYKQSTTHLSDVKLELFSFPGDILSDEILFYTYSE